LPSSDSGHVGLGYNGQYYVPTSSVTGRYYGTDSATGVAGWVDIDYVSIEYICLP
jgi:hypothetical protein